VYVSDIDIHDYGHLDGKVWVFNEVRLVDGREVKRIDFSRMILPEGAPPFGQLVEETVLAFLDPGTVHEEYEGFMEFPSQN